MLCCGRVINGFWVKCKMIVTEFKVMLKLIAQKTKLPPNHITLFFSQIKYYYN